MVIRKLTWQFFIACSAIVVVTLWFSTWYSVRIYNRLYQETIVEDVTSSAHLLKREFSNYITDPILYPACDSLCKVIGTDIRTRLTVILPNGMVIGDSEKNPDSLENHGLRPEIMQALQGKTGFRERYSETLRQGMVYVAVPLYTGNSIGAVLRCAVSIKDIKEKEQFFYRRIAFMSTIVLGLLLIAAYLVSQQLSRPIAIMKKGAERFSAGDFSCKLAIPRGNELGDLATTLNKMAAALDDKLKTITRQRNELKAVFTGMTEGVIAIDTSERIISMNPVALEMLHAENAAFEGKWLHEVIRNSDLQNFSKQVLAADEVVETQLMLSSPNGDRFIQARGSALKDEKGAIIGAVLVLNDLTLIRKLENVRKEFVANVSHELRTPLTSIKGFVETLQHGNYGFTPEVIHFLAIIESKTDRLCSIVNDILTLSSIERDNEQQEIPLQEALVLPLLEDAVRTCNVKTRAKMITIDLSCDPGLSVMGNAPLLEQAFVNIIDNAVKYSAENKTVSVIARQSESGTTISITDQGIGIAPEHQERIFERFYRVDKARSRKLGGTGLGLSIVKNIMLAHGGSVSVESTQGVGSTFSMHIPHSTGQV